MYVPLLYEGRRPTDGTRVRRSWSKHGSWRCLIQWAGHERVRFQVAKSVDPVRLPGDLAIDSRAPA